MNREQRKPTISPDKVRRDRARDGGDGEWEGWKMNTEEQILLNLYRARRARLDAKEAMRAKAEALGQCDGRNHPSGPCHEEYPDDKTEWCDVCIEKLPVWEAWRRASARAGAALRKAVRFGKQITERSHR